MAGSGKLLAHEFQGEPVLRIVIVLGTLLLSADTVAAQQEIAVQQDNLMRGQAKFLYGVILKTAKGDTPYKQESIDAALAQLEESVSKISTVFGPNPKQHVVDATYGSSQKIWQHKADFESKIPPVAKAIADAKGTVKDAATLKIAYDSINGKCNECHETYRLKLK
jgi:cytochrome c556